MITNNAIFSNVKLNNHFFTVKQFVVNPPSDKFIDFLDGVIVAKEHHEVANRFPFGQIVVIRAYDKITHGNHFLMNCALMREYQPNEIVVMFDGGRPRVIIANSENLSALRLFSEYQALFGDDAQESVETILRKFAHVHKLKLDIRYLGNDE